MENLKNPVFYVILSCILNFCANRNNGLLQHSINTAPNYIRSVFEKLHAHSKHEAVSKALRNRIIF